MAMAGQQQEKVNKNLINSSIRQFKEGVFKQ
jgi:hypothetical protein